MYDKHQSTARCVCVWRIEQRTKTRMLRVNENQGESLFLFFSFLFLVFCFLSLSLNWIEAFYHSERTENSINEDLSFGRGKQCSMFIVCPDHSCVWTDLWASQRLEYVCDLESREPGEHGSASSDRHLPNNFAKVSSQFTNCLLWGSWTEREKIQHRRREVVRYQ